MSWADTHIVVMGMDTESNEKIKQAIKQRLEGWEEGECDKCASSYDLSSRDNRCGNCGNCDTCCTHNGKEEE